MQAGDVLGERYELHHPIGEGGMGTVWAAKHVMTLKPVAVKVLHAEVGEGTHGRERFVREVRVSCALEHPAVVNVQDAFVADGVPIIVMDLLEGETLGARLRGDEALPVAEVVALLSPIVEALAEAHDKGIAHRDLKPDNIFLTPSDGPKLLDFGLAKLLDVSTAAGALRTKVGMMLGTPGYMAPEQARGAADVDHRVDVWALGVILYRCLSGVRPIEGDTAAEVLARLATDVITPLRVIEPGLPEPLTLMVDRMLQREPSERPGDVREVLALFRSLEVLPVAGAVVAPTLVQPAMAPTLAGAPPPEAPRPLAVPQGLQPPRDLPPAQASRAVAPKSSGRAALVGALGVPFVLAAVAAVFLATRRDASDTADREAAETSPREDDGDSAKPRKPLKPGVIAGRPMGLRRGPGGVFLWRDLRGVWQFRLVAKRGGIKLAGVIEALDGELEDVERLQLETGDQTTIDKKRVAFAFETDREGDGLSFVTAADACVRFDIHANEQRRPERIHIGLRGVSPERVPFVVCVGEREIRYE